MNAGYLITRGASYFPDRIAFVIDGQAITYRELNSRVNRLANGLLSLGLTKGDRVGLLFHNSLAYLESYLALYKAGLVWVRLNSRLLASELQGMMEDSQALVLIHGSEFGETAERISGGFDGSFIRERPGIDYEGFLQKGSVGSPGSMSFSMTFATYGILRVQQGLPRAS